VTNDPYHNLSSVDNCGVCGPILLGGNFPETGRKGLDKRKTFCLILISVIISRHIVLLVTIPLEGVNGILGKISELSWVAGIDKTFRDFTLTWWYYDRSVPA
jgi:hypothetical protein